MSRRRYFYLSILVAAAGLLCHGLGRLLRHLDTRAALSTVNPADPSAPMDAFVTALYRCKPLFNTASILLLLALVPLLISRARREPAPRWPLALLILILLFLDRDGLF